LLHLLDRLLHLNLGDLSFGLLGALDAIDFLVSILAHWSMGSRSLLEHLVSFGREFSVVDHCCGLFAREILKLF